MATTKSVKSLTARQKEILDFILNFQEDVGRPPSGPEVSTHFGFSDHSSAYQHIKALEKKGYLELRSFGRGQQIGVRRGPSHPIPELASWPLFGSIPAGPLTDVVVDGSNKVRNLPDLIPELRSGDYMLIVNGDSMIEDGIMDGQYVVVRPNMEPEPGDICAVWVDGEGGTLKHVFYENEQVKLVPANRQYTAKSYPPDRVRIQGVLVASFAVQSFKGRRPMPKAA